MPSIAIGFQREWKTDSDHNHTYADGWLKHERRCCALLTQSHIFWIWRRGHEESHCPPNRFNWNKLNDGQPKDGTRTEFEHDETEWTTSRLHWILNSVYCNIPTIRRIDHLLNTVIYAFYPVPFLIFGMCVSAPSNGRAPIRRSIAHFEKHLNVDSTTSDITSLPIIPYDTDAVPIDVAVVIVGGGAAAAGSAIGVVKW